MFLGPAAEKKEGIDNAQPDHLVAGSSSVIQHMGSPASSEATHCSGPDTIQGIATSHSVSVAQSAAQSHQSIKECMSSELEVVGPPSSERPSLPSCPYSGLTVSSNFIDAQSLWDASMAFSILEFLCRADLAENNPLQACSSSDGGSQSDKAEPEHVPSRPLILHVSGKFHSEGWMGIYEHLLAYNKGLKVLIVTIVPSTHIDISVEEFLSQQLDRYGHFTVLTDISWQQQSL
jgi:hypothetical protein